MALKKKEVKPAENNVLDEEKYIDDLVSKVSAAQKIFATYSQEQVDEIFKRVALKMSSLRIPLAQMAAEESRDGRYGRQSYQKPFRRRIYLQQI